SASPHPRCPPRGDPGRGLPPARAGPDAVFRTGCARTRDESSMSRRASGTIEESTMVKMPIYMDNNATTRCDPRVVEAMLPFFTEHYGNAASRNHAFGWFAEEAVDTAREQIGALIGASSKEIIFTSGATESNNLAIKGVAGMYARKGKHIITQVTEHKATIDPCKRLERDG